jgi:hypothetical protein
MSCEAKKPKEIPPPFHNSLPTLRGFAGEVVLLVQRVVLLVRRVRLLRLRVGRHARHPPLFVAAAPLCVAFGNVSGKDPLNTLLNSSPPLAPLAPP